MKNTILSNNIKMFLEEAIARYGRIVSFHQLKELLRKKYALATIKSFIARIVKLGWLLRFKRGSYLVITDVGSLSSNDISAFTISQTLNKDSYISFENALAHHGMFDQMLSNVTAVTFKRARRYKVKDTEIRFFKIKKELYFGFASERSDIGTVNIAIKEKAILDILYFSSNEHYVSLVWEKLKEFKADFDFSTLKQYAQRYGIEMVRKIGFLLDKLGVEADDLRGNFKRKYDYGRLTKNSKKFDSKWRIYFDDTIIN